MLTLRSASRQGLGMVDYREFGRRLKELLAGVDQVDAAIRLGYTQSRISQMCRGEKPSKAFVQRLVEAYGLDENEWMTLAGLREPDREAEDERFKRLVGEALDEREEERDPARWQAWTDAEFDRISAAYGIPREELSTAGLEGDVQTRREAEITVRLAERLAAKEQELRRNRLHGQ